VSAGKLVNNLLKPIGIELRRVKAEENVVKVGNRYDLKPEEVDGMSREIRKIVNLLDYTKQSGTTYNAELYDAGYHTIELDGHTLTGQRVPRKRLDLAPYDFKDKVVLDLGCNQGGMLLAVADEIKQGIGLDYDVRMVNVGNRIKLHKKHNNLSFYVFDLENENLDLIDNYLPEKVDIVFLLSVCMWISTWQEVIEKAHAIADNLLFESNGTAEEQEAQFKKLNSVYSKVQLLQDVSPDDPRQKDRKLYFCEK